MYSRYTENEAESIVDHLKSIADLMERKFGLIEANLMKVDKGLRSAFLKQEKLQHL